MSVPLIPSTVVQPEIDIGKILIDRIDLWDLE
jgi:hypothetical protein